MAVLRWGIIGCGQIAGDFVTALSLSQKNHKVIAAASRTIEKAEEFVKRSELPIQAYGNYESLLSDEDVDIVYIALQNKFHAEYVLRALDAGKHVLCEKPMAVNANEVRKMIEKARAKKLFLMEALWSRFFPAWQHIKQIVDSEEIGKAVHFHFNIACTNSRLNLDNCEVPTLATGVYGIALSLFIFGEEKPIRIDAIGEKNEHGFEEWCNLTMIFPNDRRATLYYDRTTLSTWNSYVSCTKGQIQIPRFCWAPVEFTKVSGFVRAGAIKSETFTYPLTPDYGKYYFNHSEGLYFEADHVFDAIQAGKTESQVMSLDTSLKCAEISDEIRRQLGVVFPQDKRN
ncbi:Trans-1,2-dihydrobenzene-1,2-diol dehydrogenase-like protein [Aphelenchoides besseyi]|nr:Trans-1,2-dihydrobenzene-1,2-diol dehydrogenase-like protein [Aphelenchoides besseyi]KAI6211054.1 Trans-1,2-dihydrobenzene-1,2-diol dehydrogenase-like protein [Aphelenchoides besseyi]